MDYFGQLLSNFPEVEWLDFEGYYLLLNFLIFKKVPLLSISLNLTNPLLLIPLPTYKP